MYAWYWALGFVNVFDDDVARLPGRGDVAFGDFAFLEQVAFCRKLDRFDVAFEVLVNDRRIGSQCILGRKHGRQFLVFDIDELHGAARRILVAGGYGSHRLADVTHLALAIAVSSLTKGPPRS